jgi:spermidine synthase
LAPVLFVGSGFAALTYEIVWFQLLELVVGSSAISLGILLATFMGGMCLGSLWLPRVISQHHHPFRIYAWLELGIGILAIAVLFEVPLTGSLYTGSGAHGLWGVVLRGAIAGACLLPPTILMGAALPAIARWVEATPKGIAWLGFLYGSNIAGGIVGCLLAGFYLLRVHDMAMATGVAATVNVAVSLIAFLMARQRHHSAEAPEPGRPSIQKSGGGGAIQIAIAVSGRCALGAEVVWTRLLALLLGATVYTFSIILAVFLLGLGIGSGVGSGLARWSSQPRRDLGICQLLLTAAIAWAAFMLSRSLPYWPIAPSLSRSAWISFQLDLLRCLWVILPATVFWGASFPLALAAAGARGQDPGRLVAAVYAANTVGAIAGALAFTFLIIPSFGTQAAHQVLIGLSAAVGLLLFASSAWPPWKGAGYAVRGIVAVVAAILAVQLVSSVPPVPGGLVALGRSLAFRLGAHNPQTKARYQPNIVYLGEGMNESVAVSDDGHVRLFHVSGKIEASTSLKDMRLQRMLGDLPALVHPHPRSVLIVGFGAGVTAGTFVLYPSVQRIVICEIEPLVPKRVSEYFRAENYGVATDPRVKIIYDDARHYILTTKEKFDIITSDPIHPWVKGSAALYSRDYFELVRRHLNPGGVVSQWVPLYQSSEATAKGELATFFDVFSNGTVWANNDRSQGYDLVLLGTEGSAAIDLDALDARLKRPDHQAVARSLQEIGFPSAMDLLSTYTSRSTDLARWLVGAKINRDRNLWLQYQAGLETYSEQEADIYGDMSAYRIFPDDLFVGSEALKQELKTGGGPPNAGR